MNQPSIAPSNRFGALDLLRFLAVLAVFFGHYTDTFNYVYRIVPANLKYTVVSRYAVAALLLFLMISGYVVTMTSIKRNLEEFSITRLSRIYPLFWISCFFAFVLPRVIPANHSYLAQVSFKTFLFNLTMVPVLFGHPLINPVYHTLITELVFYTLIGIIIYFKLWNRILTVISIFLTICLASEIFTNESVYIFLLPFPAGMLFYLIRIKYAKSWKLYTLLAIDFILTLLKTKPLAEQLSSTYKEPNSHNMWIFSAIITVLFILFLLIILNKITIRGNSFLQLLGDITYPFYLFHLYFLFFYWYFSKTVQADVLLFGILFIALLTSWFLNIFVEKPLSRLAAITLKKVTRLIKKRSPALQSEKTSI
ncbi:acyltransferase family protein [Larkinella sp. VNQ87]|uniref:acyltransferase family protein n=1 Tax=Larkinella sp. VNQ87 TaxID=3400921 RepID=UPI003C10674C